MVLLTLTIAVSSVYYTKYAKRQWKVMQDQLPELKMSAIAAKSAADTAAANLVLGQRPWVKIKPRIVQPLTFNVPAWKGKVASMKIEETLENVGQTVAVNVFPWDDAIPIDPDGSLNTARARQSQWCDANRTQIQALTGYALFPKDPLIRP
jgi:hypothetical protein